MPTRLLPALAVLALVGCLSAPPVHPRALENNELCAQKIAEGDLTRAEVHCDLGLQFSPQYADLWVNKGLIALKRGQTDVAKDHFIKALRYNQEQAQAYNNLGYIYLKERSYGRAHDNFQRALKVNPDYLEARYNLALTYFHMGKKEEAKKEYRTILAIAPDIADPHHDMGIICFEEQNYECAVEHFQAATHLDPGYASAWQNLALALGELGRFEEAVVADRRCIDADPDNGECRNNLAIHQRKAALVDPALQQARDTRTAENTPASYFELAMTYRERGLRGEEERAYKSCLRLDDRYAPCHYGLWVLYRDERKDEHAQIACRNFLKFASADEYPNEVQNCEKYLSSNTF